MHPKAKLLRHSLASNVLGGKLEEFITEDELEAIEACVDARLHSVVSLHGLTRCGRNYCT